MAVDKRKGRPDGGVTYNLPMPRDLYARIVDTAQHERRSVAATMRLLIEDALTMHERRRQADQED